jgi:hypothetical protein
MPNSHVFRMHVEPNIKYLDKLYMGVKSTTKQLIEKNYLPGLYNTIRLVTHIQEVTLRNFQDNIEKIKEKELDLRCEYLLKEIDETEWKMKLQQNEYKLEYLTEMSQLYQMISTVSSEIVLFLYNHVITNKPRSISAELIIEKADEIYELIKYFNTNSSRLSKRFDKANYECIDNYSIIKLRCKK